VGDTDDANGVSSKQRTNHTEGETMTKIATIEGKGGGLLQRAVLLLAVATFLAAMVVATAAPAFAARQREGNNLFVCTNNTEEPLFVPGSAKKDLEAQGYICSKLKPRL
jgi:hypothetical protein